MIDKSLLFFMALLWVILAIKLGWKLALLWVVGGLIVALAAGKVIRHGESS